MVAPCKRVIEEVRMIDNDPETPTRQSRKLFISSFEEPPSTDVLEINEFALILTIRDKRIYNINDYLTDEPIHHSKYITFTHYADNL